MNHKLSLKWKVVLLIASVAMMTVLFLPIWQIILIAPQYPEGLTMKIWASKLSGDVDIINGLNHYIGMMTLHEEDFIEFKVLPFIIIGYSLLGLLVFFLNRSVYLRLYAVLFVVIAAASLTDFYWWEYRYGHNLDPTAPIQVPGMAYQPPLIGYKQLLNFSAYSFPDIGGFIFAICGILIIGAAVLDWWQTRKAAKKQSLLLVFTPFIFFLSFSLNSCSQVPEPVKYGTDNCDFCKMTIMDPKFAGELVTEKGKVMKFDDARCLVGFLKSDAAKNQKVADTYLTDFSGNHDLVKTGEGFFLTSPELKSPMNGNIALFAELDSLRKVQQQLHGEMISWKDIIK
jgi:copper chaperone NosL